VSFRHAFELDRTCRVKLRPNQPIRRRRHKRRALCERLSRTQQNLKTRPHIGSCSRQGVGFIRLSRRRLAFGDCRADGGSVDRIAAGAHGGEATAECCATSSWAVDNAPALASPHSAQAHALDHAPGGLQPSPAASDRAAGLMPSINPPCGRRARTLDRRALAKAPKVGNYPGLCSLRATAADASSI
jgi:hypothetical protein